MVNIVKVHTTLSLLEMLAVTLTHAEPVYGVPCVRCALVRSLPHRMLWNCVTNASMYGKIGGKIIIIWQNWHFANENGSMFWLPRATQTHKLTHARISSTWRLCWCTHAANFIMLIHVFSIFFGLASFPAILNI